MEDRDRGERSLQRVQVEELPYVCCCCCCCGRCCGLRLVDGRDAGRGAHKERIRGYVEEMRAR